MRDVIFKNHRKLELDCGKHKLKLGDKTLIMGILNVTPDSFSDGGKFNELEAAISHANKMIEDGADIIDIGAESTRPGHMVISDEEEIERLTPIVKALLENIDKPISVDTYKPAVAEAMLKLGVRIINDIWGLQRDKRMAELVAEYNAVVVAMHNQDTKVYSKDVIESIADFFRETIRIGTEAGIPRENIILDPGVGFGKETEHNLEVMSRLGEFNDFGCAILLGTSRKSMIGNVLNLSSDQRVEGTIATSVLGAVQGVDIVRVHDIKENVRALKLTDVIVRELEWTK